MPAADRHSDCAALRERVVETIREAGALALQTFRVELRSWIKGRSSPVSEADLAVDALLRERLLAMHPAGWLSEETEDDPARLHHDEVWVVDPIDGTRAYLEGSPSWAVSVALVRRGRPVLAALHVPASHELFLATAGAGATCNGVPIRTSLGNRLAGKKLAGPKQRLERIIQVESQIEIVPRIPSLALRLARVAQGVLDAAIAGPDSHDWDLAAADLLVHEAGGMLTTLAGDAPIYNRRDPVHGVLVAAGQERHAALLDLMRNRSATTA